MRAAHAMLKAAGPVRINAVGAFQQAAAAGAPRWNVGRLADAHFTNAGSGPIWRTVTVRGVPTSSPPEQSQGLSVETHFYAMNGSPADLGHLTQGQRMIVLIKGGSHQDRSSSVVIDDPLPAGFEIETALGPDDAEGDGEKGSSNGPYKFLGRLKAPDAQESRDDRYVAAFKVEGGKDFAVAYVARAVTPGEFYLPGAEAHDMYRPALYARSAGGHTSIQIAGQPAPAKPAPPAPKAAPKAAAIKPSAPKPTPARRK